MRFFCLLAISWVGYGTASDQTLFLDQINIEKKRALSATLYLAIPFNRSKDSIGLSIDQPETLDLGPAAFAVHLNGDVAIADQVQQELDLYLHQEAAYKEIALDHTIHDVAFLGDQVVTLDRYAEQCFVYSREGQLLPTFEPDLAMPTQLMADQNGLQVGNPFQQYQTWVPTADQWQGGTPEYGRLSGGSPERSFVQLMGRRDHFAILANPQQQAKAGRMSGERQLNLRTAVPSILILLCQIERPKVIRWP